MRRLIAAALASVTWTCGAAGIPETAHAAAPQAAGAPTRFRAGAARVPMRIPEGTPLAGYGSRQRRLLVPDLLGFYPHAFWFKPSEGRLDELAARALVMYAGDTRITWIAADLIAVDRGFTRLLGERLIASGIRAGTLIVSASHTHSGPGGFLASTVFALTAVDREAPGVRDAVLDAMVEAVRRAGAFARDARVATATVDAAVGTTRGRLDTPPDPALVVLKVTTRAGEPIAILWHYAIHGTMLGPRNLKLSGDVMGAVSRSLEAELGVPALYVNGAVGDVSPRLHGEASARSTGDALVGTVRAAWTAARPMDALPLAARVARVALPAPSLSLRHCTRPWVPHWARLPLGAFLPTETELVAVAVGRLAVVTMPGEPVTALGRGIRDDARARWTPTLVAGVSNDYLGYFVNPEDYERIGYVTCAAVYGPRLGPCLAATATDLLRRLPEPGAMTSGASPACDFR